MKKSIFLFAVILSIITAMLSPALVSAQSASLMPLVAGDTISTTAGTDTVFKYVTTTAGYSAMSIQVIATKLSGTVVGKAYLYGSLDGTNYILSDSSAAFTDVTTNSVAFTKTPPGFTKYMIQVHQPTIAASTQGVKIRVWYVLKKYSQ